MTIRPDVCPDDFERFLDMDLYECPDGCVTDPFSRQDVCPIRSYKPAGEPVALCRRCGLPMELVRAGVLKSTADSERGQE